MNDVNEMVLWQMEEEFCQEIDEEIRVIIEEHFWDML